MKKTLKFGLPFLLGLLMGLGAWLGYNMATSADAPVLKPVVLSDADAGALTASPGKDIKAHATSTTQLVGDYAFTGMNARQDTLYFWLPCGSNDTSSCASNPVEQVTGTPGYIVCNQRIALIIENFPENHGESLLWLEYNGTSYNGTVTDETNMKDADSAFTGTFGTVMIDGSPYSVGTGTINDVINVAKDDVYCTGQPSS